MPPQNVTVQLGAVLSGTFVSTFKTADANVNAFGRSVRKLDTALIKVNASSKLLNASLKAMIGHLAGAGAGLQTLLAAQKASKAQTDKLVAANKKLADSYRKALAELKKLRDLQGRPPPGPPPGPPPPPGGGGRPPGSGGNLLRAGLMTTAFGMGGLYAAGRITETSANFNEILLETAVTAKQGKEAVEAMRHQILDLATIKRTSQGPTALANGVQLLVAAGRDLNRDALPAIEAIGRAATASGASVEDMSLASNALLTGFNIKAKPGETLSQALEAAFDKMAVAGKEGAFELKDMARYFPVMGAYAKHYGMEGEQGVMDIAAALQVGKLVSGTSEGAVVNLENLFSKLESQETRNKFLDVGIDLKEVTQNARRQGQNPLAVIADIVDQQMKSGTDLGELFQDMQVKKAILSLTQYRKEYDRIRKLEGKGTIAKDFKTRQDSAKRGFESLRASISRMAISIGTLLEPALVRLAFTIERGAIWIDKFTREHPKLAEGIALAVVGLSAFIAVVGATMVAVGAAKVGIFGLTTAFGWLTSGVAASVRWLGALIPGLSAAFASMFAGVIAGFQVGGIMGAISALGSGIMGVLGTIGAAFAAVTAPVWAAVGLIIAAGALLYVYWEPVKAFFVGIWEGISGAFEGAGTMFMSWIAPIQPVIDSIGSAFSRAWTAVKNFFVPIEAGSETCSNWLVVGKALGSFIGDGLRMAFEAVGYAIKAVVWLIQQAITGIQKLIELKDYLATKMGMGGETQTNYRGARTKLMNLGVWSDEVGDDRINMEASRPLIESGVITANDLRLLESGKGAGTGEALDQQYQGALQQMVKDAEIVEAHRKMAEAGVPPPAQVVNSNSVTINAQTTLDEAGMKRAVNDGIQQANDAAAADYRAAYSQDVEDR